MVLEIADWAVHSVTVEWLGVAKLAQLVQPKSSGRIEKRAMAVARAFAVYL